MATNKSVIVLLPNARRQNVKVTQNTTILQVLEEVCQKFGYKSEDYDLKHYNRVLDCNAILRFTGLANNAQLEMITRSKARHESNVTICVQLESGTRVTGDFTPADSLLRVLRKICPEENVDTAALIYMHREIYGSVSLDDTTLRTLGINGGRAMLRLIHRDPARLNMQAHVSTPLAAKLPRENHGETDRRPVASAGGYGKSLDPIGILKLERERLRPTDEPESAAVGSSESTGKNSMLATRIDDSAKLDTASIEIETFKGNQEEVNVEYLDERNALVFVQGETSALSREELPDDFFEVTNDDARTLLRDAIRLRAQLEEAPLLTSAQRELDENTRLLRNLHKYRRTVIRIQFPDQMVLQGLFSPLETVRSVKDFIKNYLTDSNVEFVVYTTPPKTILNPDARLIDANLVPSAIIYYSGDSVLKPELMNKLTDPRIAGIQAIKFRSTMRRDSDEFDTKDVFEPSVVERTRTTQDRTMTESPAGPSTMTSTLSSSGSQVPKWFKKPFK